MKQIFTSCLCLPKWNYSIIFLWRVAFWEDLKGFRLRNLSSNRHHCCFFKKNERPIFKHDYLAKYALLWRNVCVLQLCLRTEGLNFQKIETKFLYDLRFSRYRPTVFSTFRVQLTNPVWTNFLNISVRCVHCRYLPSCFVLVPCLERKGINYSKNLEEWAVFEYFLWPFSPTPSFWPCDVMDDKILKKV